MVETLLSLVRERKRSERGSLLFEALVWSAIGALGIAGYMSVTLFGQSALRDSQARDIVDQFATSKVEEFHSMEWETLTHCRTEAAAASATANNLVINPTTQACPSRTIRFGNQTETIRNMQITYSAQVTWPDRANRENPRNTGRKQVLYTFTWKAPGASGTKSVIRSTSRTSKPSEVNPSTLLVQNGAPL